MTPFHHTQTQSHGLSKKKIRSTVSSVKIFLITNFRPKLTEFMFISVMTFLVCQGFGCFGMAMATILAAAIQIHARLITAKLARQMMGGK
jgi:hypothetical protein